MRDPGAVGHVTKSVPGLGAWLNGARSGSAFEPSQRPRVREPRKRMRLIVGLARERGLPYRSPGRGCCCDAAAAATTSAALTWQQPPIEIETDGVERQLLYQAAVELWSQGRQAPERIADGRFIEPLNR